MFEEKIRELTDEEALDILRECGDYDGYGSSRAVYELMWEGKHVVIKVACDREGRLQNRVETRLFRNRGVEGYLANIYAKYKDYFHIMEYIDVLDCDLCDAVESCDITVDMEDEYEDEKWNSETEKYEPCTSRHSKDYGYDDPEEFYDTVQDMVNCITWLDQEQGDTGDNYQVGRNQLGDIVAYDYGYNMQWKRKELVGNIEGFDNPAKYIYDTIAYDYDIDRYLWEEYDEEDE